MSLVLSIINADSMPASAQVSQKVFAGQGGTIGRSLTDDWVLPDSQRYISGRHAVIEYVDGQYYLTDTSTNGVYLNDNEAAVGRDHRITLNNGDHLHIGEYDIAVALEPEPSGQNIDINQPEGTVNIDGIPNDLDPLALFGNSDDVATRSPASHGADYSGHTNYADVADIPVSDVMDHTPGLDEHFVPPGVMSETQIPDDWALAELFQPSAEAESAADVHEQAWPSSSAESSPSNDVRQQQAVVPVVDTAPLIPDNWDQITDSATNTSSDKPLPPVPHSSEHVDVAAVSAEQPLPVDNAVAMETGEGVPQEKQAVVQQTPVPESVQDKEYEKLLHTLGIDKKDIPPALAAELPVMIGLLVRECVSGLMDVLMARTKMKSTFRVDQTMIQLVENNPLKFSVGVDEALDNMLLNSGRGYQPALEAVRESFDDIKAHQMATVAGMQGALQGVLRRFDPEAIEQNLNSGAGRGNILLTVYHKTKYWERYKKLYDDISEKTSDDFQHLLDISFMKAYEDQVNKMANDSNDPGKRR